MQNPVKTTKKKIDKLGITILLVIIVTTSIISYQLQMIRTDIQVQAITKVQVLDNDQLKKLCSQFKNQWKADNYAMYLYQPNSPVKTHKELAASSLLNMTLRLPLDDYRVLNKNKIEFGSVKKLTMFNQENIDLGKSFVRVPIYQYSVIVGELYLFYDETANIDSGKFDSMITETQIISQLLK